MSQAEQLSNPYADDISRTEHIQFRCTEAFKSDLNDLLEARDYSSVSEYLRTLVRQDIAED